MTLQSILSATKKFFTTLTKSDLVELIVQLKKDFSRLDTRYKKLEQENAELKAQLQKQKIIEVNKQSNKPSSKKAEWEKPTSKKSDSNQDNPKKQLELELENEKPEKERAIGQKIAHLIKLNKPKLKSVTVVERTSKTNRYWEALMSIRSKILQSQRKKQKSLKSSKKRSIAVLASM